MIVRPADGALHLITQPDHAALAARIMMHWTSLATAARRDDILLAVREHDHGWSAPDLTPQIDTATGGVLDFVHVPAAVRQGVWPRSVAALAERPWAAALVAHHALSVYDRLRGDAAWDGFFSSMQALRDAHVATTGRPITDLTRDYVYLRLGDLASLAFCNAWSEPQTLGPWTLRLDGRHLLVEPNPFVHDIAIEIGARELRATQFDSDAALRTALEAAPTVTIQGVVVGRTRTS